VTTFVVSLILISLWVGFYQLVKQQGRVLLRLDDLERAMAARNSDAHGDHDHHHADSDGLPWGSAFPNFELADLTGATRKLSEFRGQRLLLLSWSFDCGFCEAIVDDLARFEPNMQAENARILLLSSGDADSNRKHADELHITSQILLVTEQTTPAPFQQQGTPVAYFVDERGRVAAPLASGADQVVDLARRIAGIEAASSEPAESAESNDSAGIKGERNHLKSERALSESRIERNGLKAGTKAPGFSLPDLQGGTVSLEDYRNQRVLLVFSDPHCGPCDEIAPHLANFHRENRDNGVSLILVGRGDEQENRDKARKFGFDFPVVLQDKWKLSKAYGIFATPVAFLIAENGVIAKDVAVGKDAILALAADAARVKETTAQ
jgi:peroxiredoxin